MPSFRHMPPLCSFSPAVVMVTLASLFGQVFKNPYEVVTVLLVQTLGAMVPSIPVCLSTAMDQTPHEDKLEALLELYQTAATFGRNLESAMLPHLGEFWYCT